MSTRISNSRKIPGAKKRDLGGHTVYLFSLVPGFKYKYNFSRSSTTIILCIVAATILKIKERLREKVAQCSNK